MTPENLAAATTDSAVSTPVIKATTIRSTIAAIISQGGDPDAVARLICGYLSWNVGLDNGNGHYDDDAEMADGGLGEAEMQWLARSGQNS